jgi:hypothetical protein
MPLPSPHVPCLHPPLTSLLSVSAPVTLSSPHSLSGRRGLQVRRKPRRWSADHCGGEAYDWEEVMDAQGGSLGKTKGGATVDPRSFGISGEYLAHLAHTMKSKVEFDPGQQRVLPYVAEA